MSNTNGNKIGMSIHKGDKKIFFTSVRYAKVTKVFQDGKNTPVVVVSYLNEGSAPVGRNIIKNLLEFSHLLEREAWLLAENEQVPGTFVLSTCVGKKYRSTSDAQMIIRGIDDTKDDRVRMMARGAAHRRRTNQAATPAELVKLKDKFAPVR
jgi:hypothetical protein